jgi:hypothetical protein
MLRAKPKAWRVWLLVLYALLQSDAAMEELTVGGGSPQDHGMRFNEELDTPSTEGGWIVEGVQKMLDSPACDWSSVHLFFPTARLMQFIGQHPLLSASSNVTQSPSKVCCALNRIHNLTLHYIAGLSFA